MPKFSLEDLAQQYLCGALMRMRHPKKVRIDYVEIYEDTKKMTDVCFTTQRMWEEYNRYILEKFSQGEMLHLIFEVMSFVLYGKKTFNLVVQINVPHIIKDSELECFLELLKFFIVFDRENEESVEVAFEVIEWQIERMLIYDYEKDTLTIEDPYPESESE